MDGDIAPLPEIGVLGGYVAGSRALRDMLIQRARPFLFSTSHPPAPPPEPPELSCNLLD